eukprot:scaffold471_cov318-Ochromonas_danica.AAC.3
MESNWSLPSTAQPSRQTSSSSLRNFKWTLRGNTAKHSQQAVHTHCALSLSLSRCLSVSKFQTSPAVHCMQVRLNFSPFSLHDSFLRDNSC